jgi:hypothetical protein|tara:strand:- start:320 stop:1732 length:1413 start_codon:yes stop_codon:yes gene_type:complete
MGVTIPSAAGEVLEQYEVSNSLRFNNDGASDGSKLSRSVSGNLSKAHTFSLWVKRGNLKASGRQVLAAMGDGSGDISWLEFNNDRLAMIFDGAGNYFPKTDAVFRDPSAWYHIVAKVDTTQSSASERLKLYVNGTQFTDTSGTNPPQNHQAAMDACVIGFNGGDEFDGYMAEFHFLDGAAYDPTYFGRFDANGVWVPKKYTGGNYGTNGFYFEFKQTGTSANSSGIGADTSGEDHHFTPESLAATDVSTDTCTNNFATLNPIDLRVENNSGGLTLTEGNLEAVGTNDGNRSRLQSTIGVSSGKWYAEFKIVNGNDHKTQLGIIDARGSNANHGGVNHGLEYRPNDDQIQIYDGGSNGASQTSLTGAANNDIVGIALDVDATTPTVQFYLQGSALGNAANYDLTIEDRTFFFYVRDGSDSGSDEPHYVCNFGSPPYTVSSGNADANGHGNFEYAPPSGYFALCTKNLAEFG